ncbi:hypothetical protein BZA05DRAFT_414666 [Tricharina praecox]|uniref:uncharacterized protein n=1 Tax=Tricharina praecox TaxID=43433 RepID=UPI00221E4997|nr:uncharacterized protein BZA05DRAFT_414666 [Tricharina praecox]KAI5858914.1 hypothetical protein BZA05DRAFT_414666 [Tricharina praecox]
MVMQMETREGVGLLLLSLLLLDLGHGATLGHHFLLHFFQHHHHQHNHHQHNHYHNHYRYYNFIQVPAVMPISVSTTPAVKPSTAPSSPTPNVDKKSWQQKLSDHCEATNLPKPVFGLMSDRRARYWYNGHYNAYEDAAELMLNIFEKRSNGEQQSPTSPQTSPQTARPYFGSDEFSNYTTTAGSSSEAAVRAGGGVGVGVGVGSIGGNGSYTYGSIGDAVVGQGLGGGLRHTHSHSLAHGSQARGAASFVSNYGG